MFALKNILLLVIFVITTSGCNVIKQFNFQDIRMDEMSPIGVQGLIFQDNYYILRSSDTLCVYVDEAKLWESNDFWNTGDELPLPTIYVDSVEISDFTVTRLGQLITIFDADGNQIGQHGGGYTLCPIDLDLSEGDHSLTVNITSTSGIEYSLAIDFEVVLDT